MVIEFIFTILAALIGVFELAIFAIILVSGVKKDIGVFIIGAVVCAVLTVALSVVGIIHMINF